MNEWMNEWISVALLIKGQEPMSYETGGSVAGLFFNIY